MNMITDRNLGLTSQTESTVYISLKPQTWLDSIMI